MINSPYKFTEEKRARYLGCLRQGMRRGQAAKCAGVTRQATAHYARLHPEFLGEVEQAELEGAEIVEDALLKTALKGNVTAQIFYLTNRANPRWSDRRQAAQIHVTPPALAADQLQQMQDELLKKLEELK